MHELAHVADFGIDQSEPTEKALADAESQAAALRRAFAEAPRPPTYPSFAGHGPRFVRGAMHLRWRMMRGGAFTSIGEVLRGALPLGSFGVARYWSRLLPEMRRLCRASIFDVVNHAAPTTFRRQYRDDLAAWCAKQTELTPAACRAVFRALAETDSWSTR